DWIYHQLGINANGADNGVVGQLTQIFPSSLEPVPPRASTPAPSGQMAEVDLWGSQPISGPAPQDQLAAASPADRRVVHLWRLLRSESSLQSPRSPLDSDNA